MEQHYKENGYVLKHSTATTSAAAVDVRAFLLMKLEAMREPPIASCVHGVWSYGPSRVVEIVSGHEAMVGHRRKKEIGTHL